MRELIIPLEKLIADDSIYGVRIRASETKEGHWEARVEFESASGIRVAAPHGEAHATRTELEAWAAGVEKPYLDDALQRASSENEIEKAPPKVPGTR